MILELTQDFSDAIAVIPKEHVKYRILNLLDEAIRRDIQIIARHPTTLFQCLWNLGWWYDSDEAQNHYDPPEEGWGPVGSPWNQPEPRLYRLLERWRDERAILLPTFVWLRSLRPMPWPLGGFQILCVRAHEKDVNTLALSPDGTRIVTGSCDNTIRVWDAKSGQELDCLRGHEKDVKSVAISSDGMRIVSGSSDNTIRIWDAQSGRELACLRGHNKDVNGIAISPDEMRIISGSSDNTIRIWDFQSGRELACLRGHEKDVKSVAISSDGMRIVSGSSDNTIRVWDAQRGSELACLRGHARDVNSVALSPDGLRIVSGSSDFTIRVWDIETGREVNKPLRGHYKEVNSVAISPDGTRIISGAQEGTVRIWNAYSGEELACLRGHDWRVHCVSVSSDGAHIISGSRDGTVRMWEYKPTDRPVFARLKFRRDCQIRCVAFSPNGYVFEGGYSGDNSIRVWDTTTGKETARLEGPEVGNANNIEFNRSGFVFVEWSEATRIYRLNTLAFEDEIPFVIRALGFDLVKPEDYPMKAFGSYSETVIQDVEYGRDVAWFSAPLENIATHPSGRIWAGSGADGGYLAIIAIEGDAEVVCAATSTTVAHCVTSFSGSGMLWRTLGVLASISTKPARVQ